MVERHVNAVPMHSPPAVGSISAQVVSTGVALQAGEAEPASTLIEQARILSLLHDIGKELTSILDLEELLRAVGDRVRQLVDYDLFNVMLLNDETQRLQHARALSLSAIRPADSDTNDSGTGRRAVRQRRP
jgi:transcriptional regulator with GAF, ATPase, and Fis domain